MAQRIFKHGGAAYSDQTVVTVSSPTHFGIRSPKFLLTTGNYWETENGTPASDELDANDTFKVISVEDIFITVEEVKVKRPYKERITIEVERIVQGAKKSKTLEKYLRALIPEAFEPSGIIPDWSKCKDYNSIVGTNGRTMVEKRTTGKYKNHMTLGIDFSWRIETDPTGRKILIGTPKLKK